MSIINFDNKWIAHNSLYLTSCILLIISICFWIIFSYRIQIISNSDEAICPWTFNFSCESPYIHKGAAREGFPNEKEGEMERDGEYSDGLYAINDPRSCFFLDGRGTSCFFRSRRDAKGLRQPSEYRDWYTWCILRIYIFFTKNEVHAETTFATSGQSQV